MIGVVCMGMVGVVMTTTSTAFLYFSFCSAIVVSSDLQAPNGLCLRIVQGVYVIYNMFYVCKAVHCLTE